MKPEFAERWPNGLPHAIGAVLMQALRECPALAGAQVLDNPLRASALHDGQRIVFFEDQADRPRDAVQKRTFEFAIGIINRAGEGARTAAHTDYRAARRVLREQCMPQLTEAGLKLEGRGLVENEVRYLLENIDVGGALVQGLFAVDYRDPLFKT